MLNIFLDGASQGLIWAVLALGVFVSFRLLDFADLSCEGCITCGASVSAMLLWLNVHPLLALLASFLAGCLAGAFTGVLHTKLRIPPILAGILTMIALYSINIHIMSIATGSSGTANLSLLGFHNDTLFGKISILTGLSRKYTSLIVGFLFSAAVIGILYWFFGTELGCTIRATGDNEKMCRAQGINTDLTKILGLSLSNGLIALSGGLIAQQQGYSDVNMGTGAIVIGLASIIIGETLFAKARGFLLKLVSVVCGSVIYRVVVAFVIYSGMPTSDLKLMTAAVVIVALSLTTFKDQIVAFFKRLFPKREAAPKADGEEEAQE